MARLSQAEIQHYRSEGFVIPSFQLAKARVDSLRASLDRLILDNPGVRPEKLVSAHIEGDNGEGVKGSRDFLALASDPDIVDLVAQVIGHDVVLWGCHIFCKPAGDGYETPWHQDGHYWPIRPLATCTVWVALEQSVVENGCLRVIPGSHREKALHPHLHEDREDLTLAQRLAEGAFEESQAQDIELQPGQMSIHDVYMIHGAAPNRSRMRRTGVALRYMPGTSYLDRTPNPAEVKIGVNVNWAKRPLWLLRGEDRSGLNDFEIGHSRQA
jgi:ectoine hydroxylase-related dioxygenase (phytanoyl-CoA dioxygenase family)